MLVLSGSDVIMTVEYSSSYVGDYSSEHLHS